MNYHISRLKTSN